MLNIHGVGCCLLDEVFLGFDPHSSYFAPLMSRKGGDGGLVEGALVFFEDLARFGNMEIEEVIAHITQGQKPSAVNLGGPAVVALVHTAQMLSGMGAQVSFDGVIGDDEAAQMILSVLEKTPLIHNLSVQKGERSPTTMALIGSEERTFVNDIAAAYHMKAANIPAAFYEADIILAGGTALVPNLHTELDEVLAKAHARGCFTVVGTVYDFLNQKKDPVGRWPLVKEGNWHLIDLLVVDAEEALRISGTDDLENASQWFVQSGVGAFIITNGKKDIIVYATDRKFTSQSLTTLAVNKRADEMMAADPSLRKDTVGCGDNFIGGVIAAIGMQMIKDKNKPFDIIDASIWGSSSGGFTCMYAGGTYIESAPKEKYAHVKELVDHYYKQM